jgi:hypothetical protein
MTTFPFRGSDTVIDKWIGFKVNVYCLKLIFT